MTRRFTNKLIRFLLGIGLAGSTTMGISLFNGCERDEARRVPMLRIVEAP